MTTSAIQNFQIPVTDFKRAKKFYSTIMGYEMEEMEFQGVKLGLFQYDTQNGVGGTIIHGSEQEPSVDGTLIYLHCGDDLAGNLSRVEGVGGSIHVEKTELGPGWGFYAEIDDTEGNRVGLWLYSEN